MGPGATPSPNWPSHEPPLLTPEAVAGIHNYGGTFLGSDRGGHDVDVILRFLEQRGVNQIYVIGGDGTHRGADAIFRASAERGMAIAVAAIPKTIDNDSKGRRRCTRRALRARRRVLTVCLPPYCCCVCLSLAVDLIDRSFGFDTSFAEAQHAIKTAKVCGGG